MILPKFGNRKQKDATPINEITSAFLMPQRRFPPPCPLAAAKRWIDDYIDLEQTIAELVERKRAALVDSAEWTLANNALIALRYSADGG